MNFSGKSGFGNNRWLNLSISHVFDEIFFIIWWQKSGQLRRFNRIFVDYITFRRFNGRFAIPEAFFSRLQNRGVKIWQGMEIFPQHAIFIAPHAVFIAQQMLDQILRICKSFLKSGFFGHIWFLLF